MVKPLTADQWVRGLYMALLGRLPDPEGAAHYSNALSAGRMSPLDMVQAMAASAEFRAHQTMSSAPLLVNEQPPLPVPIGTTRDEVLEMLVSVAIDLGNAGELESYAKEDCDRFLYTLDLVPSGRQDILEIGANPYFMSLLLKLYRQEADCRRVNYFGGGVFEAQQSLTVSADGARRQHTFDYVNANIESDQLPFPDGAFDVVLYCEVLEHMTSDPQRTILELKRLLRSGGQLVLTTPNVARLENIARLVSGANIYDPYSGYGHYGRHNREYNRHELTKLMVRCGFSEEIMFTADVHENRANHYADLSSFGSQLAARRADLGQYIFSRWKNTGDAMPRKPEWLYRSYPAGELSTE